MEGCASHARSRVTCPPLRSRRHAGERAMRRHVPEVSVRWRRRARPRAPPPSLLGGTRAKRSGAHTSPHQLVLQGARPRRGAIRAGDGSDAFPFDWDEPRAPPDPWGGDRCGQPAPAPPPPTDPERYRGKEEGDVNDCAKTAINCVDGGELKKWYNCMCYTGAQATASVPKVCSKMVNCSYDEGDETTTTNRMTKSIQAWALASNNALCARYLCSPACTPRRPPLLSPSAWPPSPPVRFVLNPHGGKQTSVLLWTKKKQ